MDYVIIVAGGKGLRMGSDIPKQFLPIEGKPVLMRTIEQFRAYSAELQIILVLPQAQQAYWQELCQKYDFTEEYLLADGGATRFHSVQHGLALIPDDARGVVGVHDGVRPFPSIEVIRNCYETTREKKAVIPVIPVVETLRHIAEGTKPRGDYRLVQTPQCFDIQLLKSANRQPYNDGFTDDASVVEAYGHDITLVDGNRENIKITTPFDLKIAKALITLLVLMTLVLTGCGRRPVATATPEADSLRALHNDTLIWLAKTTLDKERVFYVIDSIEQAGGIGPIRANYERGTFCENLKEERQSEDYWKTAVATDIKGKAEEKAYYKAVAYLTNKLQVKHDFEGALRVAIPAVARMKQSDVATPTNIFIHMGDIGICHLKMSRYAEADRCFEESYHYMKKAVAADTTNYAINNALIILNNTTLFCLDAQQYDAAMHWAECVDSMLQTYRQRPNANKRVLAIQEARRLNCQACILLGQGKRKEADDVFLRYQQSEAYQQGWHHAPGEYLIAAGRYAEAVDAYADIENEIARRVGRPSLDIIQQYVFPKFRANAGAGRKDTAVAVGLRMVNALDTAIARQKKDEAAELSAIYETQEKDRQIAEQQAAISQQRLVTTSIVAAIVVTALIIFIFFRHRAAVRLANEHHKLLDAYDRLEETTTAKERIESELRIARDIQMSMVPKVFPQRDDLDMYASMAAAREVGGDLYGYLLQDDKLYFCVGDVSGKGVPASLFMAQVTRLFRTLAAQRMMPAEICTRMNAALTEDNEQGMFVTLFLGLLDLSTGHLAFCNAGHNPPIIGGGQTAGEFLKMEANAPIGLWPDLDYVGEELATIKGRPLFIYTDGLNEAEDPQQQQYGDERLLATLQRTHYESARQVIDTLTAEVERHRAGAEPNDDLTMMCIHLFLT